MSTGQTAAVTFATSGISTKLERITPNTETIEDVPASTLDQARGDHKKYEPGDLIEGGEYTFVFENDMDTAIGLRTSETITVTKPIASGNTTARTRAFTGYIKSVQETDYAMDERALINVVVKVAGDITETAGT